MTHSRMCLMIGEKEWLIDPSKKQPQRLLGLF